LEINAIQIIVAIVLLFVLFYGLSFIINMLLKTTWLSVYLYIALIIFFIFYLKGEGPWGTYLLEYKLVDYLYAASGLAGVVLGGLSIKTLRDKGYKMF
jgi:hypothetical protein